jgi:VWFA-related protein
MPQLLLLLLVLVAQDLHAQDQPIFQSGVALVHVDAEVREGGHPIADLGRESFRLTDEGNPQTIVSFGHEKEPLDVVFLFDARAVVHPDIKRVAEAAHAALSDLRQGDHIALMVMAPDARDCRTDLVLDFTGDLEEAEGSIGSQLLREEIGSQSGSCYSDFAIQGGLASAAQLLSGQPNGNHKRAIIMITDDIGSPARAAVAHDAVHDLWRAAAVVLGVIVHSTGFAFCICPESYRGVRYAAGKTGGDILKTGDAVEGLVELMHRLRTRYSLYYALPQGRSGTERKIRVQLAPDAAKHHPGAVIRVRTGYVVPGTKQ